MSIFDKKPYKSVEVGEWLFEWFYDEKNIRGCYLTISTKSAMFKLHIGGSSPTYGYLLAAAEQGLTEQLHGFIAMMYVTSNVLTQDQGFVDGLNKEINKWMRRQDKKAESAAKAVTEHEELASQSLMEDVARFADATPKERKQMRQQWKEDARGVLREDEV